MNKAMARMFCIAAVLCLMAGGVTSCEGGAKSNRGPDNVHEKSGQTRSPNEERDTETQQEVCSWRVVLNVSASAASAASLSIDEVADLLRAWIAEAIGGTATCHSSERQLVLFISGCSGSAIDELHSFLSQNPPSLHVYAVETKCCGVDDSGTRAFADDPNTNTSVVLPIHAGERFFWIRDGRPTRPRKYQFEASEQYEKRLADWKQTPEEFRRRWILVRAPLADDEVYSIRDVDPNSIKITPDDIGFREVVLRSKRGGSAGKLLHVTESALGGSLAVVVNCEVVLVGTVKKAQGNGFVIPLFWKEPDELLWLVFSLRLAALAIPFEVVSVERDLDLAKNDLSKNDGHEEKRGSK